MTKKRVVSVILTLVLIGGLALGWLRRWDIHDFIKLINYVAPADVAQLAADGGFTDYGKRLFYVNNPTVSNKETFNTQCTNREQTIVLGCYTGGNIYVFNVEDTKLDGVEQVTAAHEMLHVAYSRLGASEKSRIDKLTQDFFSTTTDERLLSVAASYEQDDPSVLPNELHSIIATEVTDIGAELEEYYSKYFINRLAVVDFARSYEQVFEDLQNQLEEYDANLNVRRSEITSREASLAEKEIQARQLYVQLQQLLSSGQVTAYNAQVNRYNSMVKDYNQEVQNIQALIEEYNSLVIARNQIVILQQDLAQSIDSRPSAIEQ